MNIAEAIELSKDMKGTELKVDYSARGGRVVDAFVADIDYNLGATFQGTCAFEDYSDDLPEIQSYCLNKAWHGTDDTDMYDEKFIDAVKAIKAGIQIVPPEGIGLGLGQISCAFE
jgi:hypothetical protein